jgi:hypothetical protein
VIRLYERPACHLCEQAWELLAALAVADAVQGVDIDGDVELGLRYGLRIPVLERSDGATLAWPFDAEAISAFLAGSAP